jgi:hypothetical protein
VCLQSIHGVWASRVLLGWRIAWFAPCFKQVLQLVHVCISDQLMWYDVACLTIVVLLLLLLLPAAACTWLPRAHRPRAGLCRRNFKAGERELFWAVAVWLQFYPTIFWLQCIL